jgi:hypothetical protein
MVITNLFNRGVLRIADVLKNGYWHVRSAEFLHNGLIPLIMAMGLKYVSLRISPAGRR